MDTVPATWEHLPLGAHLYLVGVQAASGKWEKLPRAFFPSLAQQGLNLHLAAGYFIDIENENKFGTLQK